MESVLLESQGEVRSWGFRLSSGPTELEVKRDLYAFPSTEMRKRLFIVLAALVATCLFYVGTVLRIEKHVHGAHSVGIADSESTLVPLDMLFSLIWPAGPIICVLIFLYPRPVDIRCTKEFVQITRRTFRGRVVQVRSFPAVDIKKIQYVAETLPWLDAPGCLGFFAAGERVTCLPGLKCIEAKLILDRMRYFGFHVLNDPAIPEMIEKEQLRRERGGWHASRR